MKFVLHVDRIPEPRGDTVHEFWKWTFETKDAKVCQSVNDLSTEAAARSDIAAAKTSMKGARFAKVEVA